MIKNILKETFEKIKLNEIRKVNHERLLELFTEDKLTLPPPHRQLPETQDVINKINTNQWENPPNPQSFYNSLNKSKHKAMLSDYSVEELAHMKLFKLNGYDIGYALKNFNGKGFIEIVAVHNNEPYIKGIGDLLVKSAVSNGGKYLDHFDGMLTPLYSNNGFQEYNRDKYDPTYDPDGSFKKKYGEKDVIYRVHQSHLDQHNQDYSN